jgi:holo-[acyl-carrier protein] synthase
MQGIKIKVGTDICSVSRIAKTYSRFGNKFLKRILTASETEYVLSAPPNIAQRLAVRFAAKEAASKALGVGWRGIDFKEIEVTKEHTGAPCLQLHGRAKMLAASLGLTDFEISLTHEKDYAIAYVLAYGHSNNKGHQKT